MNFMEKNGLETVSTYFKELFRASVNRDGAVELLKWLESETDFFTAPASTRHHLAQPGGLMIHSLNVRRRLREIAIRDMTDRNAPGLHHLSEVEEETVAILGLLHDVCKVGVYHQMEGGGSEFRDPLPLGHGEKSLFLITRYMALTEEEALAIRWHMGVYDASTPGARSLDAAMAATPWVWRLQEADMCAANIDEREAEKP